jgi:hypothetical protein
MYKKPKELRTFAFTPGELSIFRWVNQYNRLNYFDIAERHNRREVISSKIEAHPGKFSDFLISFCNITGNKAVFSKVDELIKATNGDIEAIGIEKDKLTIYVTMRNYGSRKILL